jgi:hypothetical protein
MDGEQRDLRSHRGNRGFPQSRSTLMNDAIDLIKDANLIVGCRLIRVDCDDKLVEYYSKFGFKSIRKNEDGDLNQMAYILRV